MAKTKETLFSKIQSEENENLQQYRQEWRNSQFLRIVIIILTLVICSALYPNLVQNTQTNEQRQSSLLGTIWNEPTLVAERDFPVHKSEKSIEKERTELRARVIPVFKPSLRSTTSLVERAITEIRLYKPSRTLTDKNIAFLESIPINDKKEQLAVLERLITALGSICEKKGFISIPLESISTSEIAVRKSVIDELIVPKSELIDSLWIQKYCNTIVTRELGQSSVENYTEIVLRTILPTLIFSRELTDEEYQLSEQSIARYSRIIKKGEIVVANGERIDQEVLAKIQSYQKNRFSLMDRSISWLMIIGNFGYVCVIYSILVLFLYFIRPKIFNDNLQFGGLSLVVVSTAFMAWLSLTIPSSIPLQYGVIIPSFAMICAILFDSRTAFYTTLTIALIAAGVRGNDFDIGLTMLSAGMLGAYTVRDVQNRTQIFRSIFFIFIGFLVPILSLASIRILEINEILQQVIIVALNSAFAPLLTFGLLWIVERTFNITTNLRLQEFDNLSHPLMEELSEKAPGTYQHTLTIARIAEQAATLIGADPLLTKVGAYYHDIGKIAKAEYFIENQINMDNKHDHLLPKKSASIIRDHVQDGIELALEYKLPKRIINFIPTHHGTLLIKHFYAEALEDAQEAGKTINENDFRYPGPKPNSKETAIVMLADVAEALSRSLNTDDPDELEQALDSVFRERILDGQFDECDITMNDINRIKDSFIRSLSGIHHHRIKYKEINQEED